MKKILLLIFISFSLNVSAQEFNVGDNVASFGLGLGGAYGVGSYSSQTPGLSVQLEHGMWPIDGPGVISLGGFAGYKGYKYDGAIGNYRWKHKWNWIVLGLRSAYHYNGLEVDNLDVYAGLMLSYNILSYSYSDNDPYLDYGNGSYNSGIGLTVYAGGRYYFNEKIGAFLELGYGVAYANIGLAVKL